MTDASKTCGVPNTEHILKDVEIYEMVYKMKGNYQETLELNVGNFSFFFFQKGFDK